MEITNHRLTSAARDVIKRAQQLAATRQHAELSPEHLLLALLSDRQTTAAQSLRGQGIDPDSVIAALETAWIPELRAAPNQAVTTGEDAKLVVHFAAKEAFQLSRREIDTLHLLLGIFYLQRGTALRVLREAGANLVGLREYVLVKSSASPTLLSKEDKLWDLFRPSPIFLAMLASAAGSGAALFAAGEGAVKGLTILFVVSTWIVSVRLHEFGHALTASSAATARCAKRLPHAQSAWHKRNPMLKHRPPARHALPRRHRPAGRRGLHRSRRAPARALADARCRSRAAGDRRLRRAARPPLLLPPARMDAHPRQAALGCARLPRLPRSDRRHLQPAADPRPRRLRHLRALDPA
ncbi:MAG: Clp protease N-terminal domain-containing protein [Thermomicrobiales bacterium]